MEWVEVTAKSLEHAKERALDQLGVDESDAEFEVLAEPRGGLFGLVRGEARVRARVRPAVPRAKEERRDRKRRPRASGEGPPGAGVSSGQQMKGPGHRRFRKPTNRSSNDSPKTSGAVGRQGDTDNGSRSRRNVGPQGGREMEVDVPLEDQAGLARDFLEGLLNQFELSAEVQSEELDEDTLEVRVTGDDLGLLIGPKGSTLGAIQDLTRTVVQRKSGGRTARLLVDVGGYRQKRKVALEKFTRQIAEEVLASRREEVLEPMIPPDRKVVHDTINSIPGLVTRSQGEEPARSVVVSPGDA